MVNFGNRNFVSIFVTENESSLTEIAFFHPYPKFNGCYIWFFMKGSSRISRRHIGDNVKVERKQELSRKRVMNDGDVVERKYRTACGDGSGAGRERNNSTCGAKMPCSAQLAQKSTVSRSLCR